MSHPPRCRIVWPSALVIVAMLVSCSHVSAAHTVAWYLGHGTERRDAVERCENDPGTLGNTPACVNAMTAAAQAGIGSLRDLPPMGLEGGGRKGDSGRQMKGPGER